MGNIRTAVFNWLFAQKTGGTFILRIEDTDAERSSKESENGIYEDLEWLGIAPQESPVHGGSHGPYRQMERLELYKKHADQLIEKGLAYWCYCSPDELEVRRKSAMAQGLTPGYDNRCRNLSESTIQRFISEGRKASLRFRVPENRKVRLEDAVRGTVEWDAAGIPDFVIMKSDGTPTYHFGVVVDDHAMEITHVIRGQGHLDNTALHLLLYEAFGFTPPKFAHISHTRGLSKRKGSENIRGYREAGYMPEAVLNYACLLGWYPRDGKEKFDPRDKAKEFELSDLQKADSMFDHDKFNWLAAQYIKETEIRELARRARPFFEKAGVADSDEAHFEKVIDLVRPGVSILAELPEKAAAFYRVVEPGDEEKAVLTTENSIKVLALLREKVSALQTVTGENFDAAIAESGKTAGVKGKELYFPVRAALLGRVKGPELKFAGPLLGKDEILKRLGAAKNIE
jgi:nondiscriminating glutamyl-tRNA synthetase